MYGFILPTTRFIANWNKNLKPNSKKRSQKANSALNGSTCTHSAHQYFWQYISGITNLSLSCLYTSGWCCFTRPCARERKKRAI